MQSIGGSTAYETLQHSGPATEATSLSSGVPTSCEGVIHKPSRSSSSVGPLLGSVTVGGGIHFIGIGAQFEGDGTQAALSRPRPAVVPSARAAPRQPCKTCPTAATSVDRNGAVKQAVFRRRRFNNDIDLRLLEEGEAHQTDTVGTTQRPSVTRRICLFVFGGLAVLTLGLMTFGLTWPNADHYASRKGVLFGGLVALTLFVGGAMAAGGCSVIEEFAMASLLVASGSLVQGLWIAAANQV